MLSPERMKFGAHMSTAGGVWKALERAKSINCDCCQVFVKNNMQWFGKPYGAHELQLFTEALAATRIDAVFGHAGYLINLAAPESQNRENSLKSLIQEVELATSLELPCLVLHPGAHLGAGEVEGIRRVGRGLDQVFAATRKSRVRIALENTAGQGTCLGGSVEHLAAIYENVRKTDRLGICLDTAHLFAAGYDIRQQKIWNALVMRVSSLIGIKEILAFHLNDSKTDLNSRVDRHAHIGEGKLGKSTFSHVVNDTRFRRHPACIETPKSKDLHEDIQNLSVLRALARLRRRLGV
jgi:deoxyribonuclease-4